MSRRFGVSAVVLSLVMLPLLLPATLAAQGRGGQARARSGPPPVLQSRPIIGVRSSVFMGSYFYDPFFFGPSPWGWRGGYGYPYGYFPVFNNSADVRVLARPKNVKVFVDGFYAGVGDDFDGAFQRLSLSPGGHTIVLYLDGFQTVRHNLYLRPGSTIKLHDEMERLAPGQTSEPPPVAPAPVAPPPDASYRAPRAGARPARPLPGRVRGNTRPAHAEGFGVLAIRVQPVYADVTVDGERWESSDEGQFELNLAAGRHRVEVTSPGFRPFSAEVEVRDGEPTPLNVSLAGER